MDFDAAVYPPLLLVHGLTVVQLSWLEVILFWTEAAVREEWSKL